MGKRSGSSGDIYGPVLMSSEELDKDHRSHREATIPARHSNPVVSLLPIPSHHPQEKLPMTLVHGWKTCSHISGLLVRDT